MFRIRNHLFFAAAVFSLFWSLTSLLAQTNSVAIFKFRPTNIEAMSHNAEILYALISALEQEKSISVMPRREMQEALERSGLVQNDNPAVVIKAGKAVGVGFVLFGNVTRKGGQILTQMNLMDVENKQIVKTWNETFSGREDILNKMASFAPELSTTIRDKARAQSSPSKQQAKAQIDVENLRVESRGKEIAVSWELAPSHPAAGFNVYRSEDGAGPYQFIGRTSEAGFNDANVKKGKTYYYRIGIITDSGKETKGKRAAQTIYIGEDVPYPPVMVSVKGFIQMTEIKFVPSLLNERERFKIKEYKIYRQDEPGGRWVYIDSVDRKKRSGSGMVYTVEDTNDIEDGTTYAYAISSVDKKQRESSMSEPTSVTTIAPPSLMTEKGGMLGKIKLTWQPLENIDGYLLYRKNELGDWEKLAKISKAEQFEFVDDEDLLVAQQHEYYLTAYDDEEETGRSNVVVAKTKDLPPPPEDLKAESGLVKSVRITWTPIDDPDVGGYYIYRGTDRQEMERIAKVKGYESDSFVDKSKRSSPLMDGTDYFYAIECFSRLGKEGGLSQPSMATTKPTPSRVKGLAVTTGEGYFRAEWDRNPEPDIRGYILYRSRNKGKWEEIQKLDSDQANYRDDDLKPEDSYVYRVIAEDEDGLRSDPADSDSFLNPVGPVLAVEKDNLLRKVEFSWQPLKNVKGYYLYRRPDQEDWKRVGKISGWKKGGHTDKKKLTDGQQYEYYLTAYDSEGETSPSNVVKAKTKDLPPSPEGLNAQGGLVKSVRITWTPVDDPDVGGYVIYRGTDSDKLENITKVKGLKSNSFLDKGGVFSSLEDGKDYYYSIVAYNLFGAEGELSQPSVATTKPRPSSIKGLTATAEQDHILVRWDSNREGDIKTNTVYRSRNDRSWSKVASLKPDLTSYVDRDLKPESDYRYRIIVEDKDGLKSDPAESGSAPSRIVKAE